MSIWQEGMYGIQVSAVVYPSTEGKVNPVGIGLPAYFVFTMLTSNQSQHGYKPPCQSSNSPSLTTTIEEGRYLSRESAVSDVKRKYKLAAPRGLFADNNEPSKSPNNEAIHLKQVVWG